MGGEVLILRSTSSVESPPGVSFETFDTVKDLEVALKKFSKKFDILFHTASVSDFTPAEKIESKLDSKKDINILLKPAPKIINSVKIWNPEITLVGFKAVYKLTESELLKTGRSKLKESNADFIIVNDVGKKGIGFGADDNEVYIVSKERPVVKIAKSSKQIIARKIIDFIFN